MTLETYINHQRRIYILFQIHLAYLSHKGPPSLQLFFCCIIPCNATVGAGTDAPSRDRPRS
jgi:hypothetical protein